ncbi:hypothetical protein L596_026445 [Steinernema carpocapsae]|uniref:Uncharacterized protein n=1 Tax=Steinernema carpocapsae TaxID=34508 RepID=A0A4U5M2D5_STECR|nr:hypothetical protein L596_026445 [Steinernema carpocapsae]
MSHGYIKPSETFCNYLKPLEAYKVHFTFVQLIPKSTPKHTENATAPKLKKTISAKEFAASSRSTTYIHQIHLTQKNRRIDRSNKEGRATFEAALCPPQTRKIAMGRAWLGCQLLTTRRYSSLRETGRRKLPKK